MKKEKKTFNSNINQTLDFTIINQGTIINGDLITDKNIKLNGLVKGNCTTKNKIIISEKCEIEGNIKGSFVDIYGKVSGDIIADNYLHIASSASVTGNCSAKKLKIDEGAFVQGNINKPKHLKVNEIDDVGEEELVLQEKIASASGDGLS